jgi:hypothetical protein
MQSIRDTLLPDSIPEPRKKGEPGSIDSLSNPGISSAICSVLLYSAAAKYIESFNSETREFQRGLNICKRSVKTEVKGADPKSTPNHLGAFTVRRRKFYNPAFWAPQNCVLEVNITDIL